jgi:hypothetical protein
MKMHIEEAVALITWVNQHDPRVQVNKGSRDMWAHSLAPYTYDECRQAILDHYRLTDEDTVTPAKIRKRAEMVRNQRAGFQSAIDATPKPAKTEADYRRKIRETPEFMALFEAGRREGNEIRAAATRAREGKPDHGDSWAA